VASPQLRRTGVSVPAQYAASKVPQITVYFWIIKILTTAMGEALADFLAFRYGPVPIGVIGTVAFVAALVLQFRVRTYMAWVYWFAVAMVAVFGTMAADVLHVEFGVPYIASTVLFAATLAVVFTAWHRSEGTLSIHSIRTRRRESFYWAAVLATFAMGTAAGDLAAYTAKLGFLDSGLLFAALFALPAIAYRFFNLNAIVAFWIAYILTRPLGASSADWLGKSRRAGGVQLGDGPVTAVLFLAIVACVAYVAYVARTGNDRASSA